MTLEEVEAAFEKHDGEYHKFERVQVKRSKCHDLHALLVLTELYPDFEGSAVAAAEYDEIFLFPDIGDDSPLTEEIIIELIRCGVRYDTDNGNGLAMFA